MTSTQIYEAIINGDVDITYFQAWLFEKIQLSYVEGYSDSNEDSDKARQQFLSECG